MLTFAVADSDVISLGKEPVDLAQHLVPLDDLVKRGAVMLVAYNGDKPYNIKERFGVNPSSAMVFEVLEALDALRSGMQMSAKEQFDKLLQREWLSYTTRHLAALNHLSLWLTYQQADNLEHATGIYRHILDEFSHFFEAQLNLGVCYAHQDRCDLAEICFSNASKLHPKEPSVHNNLGVLHEYKHNLVQAEQDFRRSIKISPFFEIPRNNLRQMGCALEEKKPGESFKEAIKTAWPATHYLMHPAYDILKKCLDEANAVGLVFGHIVKIGEEAMVIRQYDDFGHEKEREISNFRAPEKFGQGDFVKIYIKIDEKGNKYHTVEEIRDPLEIYDYSMQPLETTATKK